MIIRKLDDVEKTSVDMEGVKGIAKQLVIGSGDGAPNFSFRVFTLEPGGHMPHHSHEVEHVNFVLSGQGALMDGDGKSIRQISPLINDVADDLGEAQVRATLDTLRALRRQLEG